MQFQATTLGGKSMQDFLSQIKALSDALASVRSPIMFHEHIDSILEGLLSDYHSINAIIESKFEPIPIEQVEALLLAHEACLNKFTKQKLSDSPLINYRKLFFYWLSFPKDELFLDCAAPLLTLTIHFNQWSSSIRQGFLYQ